MPDSCGRCVEAHQDKLAAGTDLRGTVVDGNNRLLQGKWNRDFRPQADGKPRDCLTCGGDESHGIEFRFRCPQLKEEAAFPAGYPYFHIVVFLAAQQTSHVMMTQPCFVAGREDGGDSYKAPDVA